MCFHGSAEVHKPVQHPIGEGGFLHVHWRRTNAPASTRQGTTWLTPVVPLQPFTPVNRGKRSLSHNDLVFSSMYIGPAKHKWGPSAEASAVCRLYLDSDTAGCRNAYDKGHIYLIQQWRREILWRCRTSSFNHK